MRTRSLIAALIPGALLLIGPSGCSSAPKAPPYISGPLEKEVAKKLKESPRGEDLSPLVDRKNQVLEVAASMDAEVKKFEKRIKELTGEANVWGYESVGMKRAGLAAGIAAAALVAASPANAVWVAALSGFSGAVNGFSAASSEQGFSKGVIASYVQPIVLELQKEVSEFSLGKARQLMWDDKDKDKFSDELAKQAKRVQNVRILNVKLMQPVTASDEVLKNVKDTLDKVNEQLKQNIKGPSTNTNSGFE